jgi:hypothetical protein
MLAFAPASVVLVLSGTFWTSTRDAPRTAPEARLMRLKLVRLRVRRLAKVLCTDLASMNLEVERILGMTEKWNCLARRDMDWIQREDKGTGLKMVTIVATT